MKKSKLLVSLVFGFFVASNVVAAPKYISPNSGGKNDSLVIPFKVSDKRFIQGWSLVIMNSNHEVVRTIENKVALPTKVGFKGFFKQLVTAKKGIVVPEEIIWNGAMDNGEIAPDGLYYYYITATDDNGNTGKTKEYEVVIDTVSPEVDLIQPTDKIFGEGAKSQFRIKQSGSKEDLWTGTFRSANGEVVKTYTWKDSEPATFNWGGTNDEGNQLPDGVYSYEITATDRAGNISNEAVISNIIYSAYKPATNIIVEGTRYFSPKTESSLTNVSLEVTIPVPQESTGNKLVEWNVNFVDSKNNVVKSYNQEKNGENPLSSIVFDGIDDNGSILPDGEYKAVVNAKYLNGYVPTTISSPILVLDTTKPVAQIVASDKVFGAGTKSTVTYSIMINPEVGAPVPSWKGEIKSSDQKTVYKTYDLGTFPPESVVWNGICDDGTIAPKGDYVFVVIGSDLAGNMGGGVSKDLVTFDTTESQLLLAVNDGAFSPNADGVKDSVSFTPITQTKDVVAYEFQVKDSSGKVVHSQKADKNLPVSFAWNGHDDSNIICKDGNYTAELAITAANGSTANAVSSSFVLDTEKPNLMAQIPWADFSPDGDGAQDNIPVAITNCTNEKLWTCDVRNEKDVSIKKYTWNGTKSEVIWDGSDESGNLAKDGKYNIILFTTDDAGNSFSTELKGINLDSRVTKAYLTAEYEGISPNGDKILESQIFNISTTVADGISSWAFDVRSEDGTAVYSLSEKDMKNLPAQITWNGANKEGNACEGTYLATLEINYKKGNRVSAVSSGFVCTATPPILDVRTAPEYFSPDNDGVDDDLFVKLGAKSKAKIKTWSFIIKDPKGKDFWRLNGKNNVTERIIWDGLSNVQKATNGKAERVQSAMDYPYEFTATDNLGMTSVLKGVIPVDVLVIRDGNVLKMAVPSIIFESDAANFQNASAKLNADQIDKNLKTLNRIADILKKFKDYKVTIVGHANKITDNPDEETVDNPREWGRASMPLSKERADAIKAYLEKRGVSSSALTSDGMGGTMPVVDPKDKDNNWKNRRVEFILEK